jgi:hypothetical protein
LTSVAQTSHTRAIQILPECQATNVEMPLSTKATGMDSMTVCRAAVSWSARISCRNAIRES